MKTSCTPRRWTGRSEQPDPKGAHRICGSFGVVATRAIVAFGALLLVGRADPAAVDAGAIAPTGSLRVAVGVAPSASPFWATRDVGSGALRGVTVDLALAAATDLGVPLKLVEYANSGEIAAAAPVDAWDISFMPRDPARDRFVDSGPAYVLYQSSYIVRAGSDIGATTDVDRAGVRVGVVAGTSTSRTVVAALRNASVEVFPQAGDAMSRLAAGRIDALAMGREALVDLAKRTPGARLLDEVIQATGVVVVVPKNHPATRAWAARFLEDAKANGTVRRALDAGGFVDAPVAPPGIVPGSP